MGTTRIPHPRVRRIRADGVPDRAPPALRAVGLLSAVIVVLMVLASLGGLLVPGMYRDSAPVAAQLRGYDVVTLVIAVPVLAGALVMTWRGSRRAQLVWVGMLAYAVYDYAFYVFGAAFNAFFLVHVAILSGSIFALAVALANLDVAGIAGAFRPRTPTRWIGGLLMLLAVGLGVMWTFYAIRFAVTGRFPEESLLVLPPASVHLAYALDLSLLVPGYALASVLLWRRAPWGYVLAGMLLPFGVVYQVNYMVALAFQARAGVPGAVAFDPLEPVVAAAFLVATVLLLGNLRSGSAIGRSPLRSGGPRGRRDA